MPVRSILILAAMKMEANAVADALRIPRPGPVNPVRGVVQNISVSSALIGIRAKALPAELANFSPDLVLLAGLSGALDPSLKIGDIVIDEQGEPHAFPLVYRRGSVEAGDQIISTAAQKAELFRGTGALAFDMESAIVRGWAAARGVPFLAVRSISDRADQMVVPEVVNWVDRWGRPRLLRILCALGRNPRRVVHLRQLARDSGLAARNLGTAVREIVGFFVKNEEPATNRSEP